MDIQRSVSVADQESKEREKRELTRTARVTLEPASTSRWVQFLFSEIPRRVDSPAGTSTIQVNDPA